jgi:hypothetical protein
MIWAECLWLQRSEFDGDAFSVLIASATTEAVLRLKRQPPPRLGWRHDELPARVRDDELLHLGHSGRNAAGF